MEAIIFCGVQASGKTTYYAQHFLKTHVCISLDLLRTRNRERIFLQSCLCTSQPFVVDNTNPTTEDRRLYIEQAKAHRFRVVASFFKRCPQRLQHGMHCEPKRNRYRFQAIMALTKVLQPLRAEEDLFNSIG